MLFSNSLLNRQHFIAAPSLQATRYAVILTFSIIPELGQYL
jgi:hypothetical protein